MTKEQIYATIANALECLGVHGHVEILYPSKNAGRITVLIDDEYFGIFDTARNTFVD